MKKIETQASRKLNKKALDLSEEDYATTMREMLSATDNLLDMHLPSKAFLLSDQLKGMGLDLSSDAMRELGSHVAELANVIYRLKKALDTESNQDISQETQDWVSRGVPTWRAR